MSDGGQERWLGGHHELLEAATQILERPVTSRNGRDADDLLLHPEAGAIAVLRLVQGDVRLHPIDLRRRRVLKDRVAGRLGRVGRQE